MATETWLLNETLTDTTSGAGVGTSVNFISNDTNYVGISVLLKTGREGLQVDYSTSATESTTVYNTLTGSGWVNGAYRTITFETAPTGDFLTWLQTNGTKQEEPATGHKLTFDDPISVTVNGNRVTSPYQLVNGDKITATSKFKMYVNGSYVNSALTFSIQDQDISITKGILTTTTITCVINYIETSSTTKLSYDLSTSSKWTSLSSGTHQVTIVAQGTGYRDSEPSAAVVVSKAASKVTLKAGTYRWNETLDFQNTDDEQFEIDFPARINTLTADNQYGEMKTVNGLLAVKNLDTVDLILIYGRNLDSLNQYYVECTDNVRWKYAYYVYVEDDQMIDKVTYTANDTTLLRTFELTEDVQTTQQIATWITEHTTKVTAPTLISFTIAGKSYQAEEGMTWGQWVNSKYNTGGFRNAETSIYGSEYPVYDSIVGSAVLPTNTIVENRNYTYTTGGNTQ